MVLEAFPPGRTAIGVTELARRCGLAKATTHRTLRILETIGMVERQEAGYLLGCLIRRLADIHDGRSPSQLRDCVLPYMLDLYEETHLTVHLGVWTGESVLIGEPPREDRQTHLPGGGSTYPCSLPCPALPCPALPCPALPCPALGRVLLAHTDDYSRLRVLRARLRHFTAETVVSPGLLERELAAVRAEGLACSWNQSLPDIADIAAPIQDADECVVAAISVSGPLDASTSTPRPVMSVVPLALRPCHPA
ncbi:DNA-binding IclR family transcriptional regulator [Streptomyces umbrinus]|uniref:DNA-binding IclR family transcriptional regulator n=1 Tax=Streptomyces umbrinus TaxID=67370 RepID=A0ABU0SMR5_9ACTN|nr:DNA-binding IclR family transcriptional regulator [Streptomyces umbrinus]